MCGIAGYISNNIKNSNKVLDDMLSCIAHRGPDGSGTEYINVKNTNIALGHKRLSVIDLSDAGAQPMRYEDLTITFNGEIYNFLEIKSELEHAGHTFKTSSDTEVLLHAYKQWGIKCIDRLIGMFAFVLLDKTIGKVFCVRDRAGIKPFFYYKSKDLFLFASELKSFHEHPGFVKEINLDSVAAFMQYGNVPTPYSIFKNCYKLRPGHYLEINIGDMRIEECVYWNVYNSYNKPKLDIDFEEAKSQTEKLLISASKYRMIADVPVGVFLSAGYDSACLTALLQNNSSDKLKTYTIAVPDLGLNEAPYAAEIAKYLGTDHNEMECSYKEAFEIIKNIPFYYDEPFGDSSAVPTTLVCAMARKEVTVALSADAGDEVFAGYNRYDYLMKLGPRLKSTPPLIRKSIAKMMNAVSAEKIPVLKKKYNFPNRYEKLKNLLQDPDDTNIMLSLSRQFSNKELHSIFKDGINDLETRYANEELKKQFYSPLSYMMAIDYQTYLVDDILQKVDRASMSVSLEAREPYLDHRLIEFAARLPDHYKYNKGIKKYILKEITHKYIPSQLMNRPKMGFAVPFEKWLQQELKDQLLHYSDSKYLTEQGIFNPEGIKQLITKFLNGKTELGLKVWYFFMFQLWHEKWMKN